MVELVNTLAIGNDLGECVVWDGRTGHLWWVDINARMLLRADAGLSAVEQYRFRERLASFALTTEQSKILGAFESGLAKIVPGSDAEMLVEIEAENPGSRLNDGRVDPYGRFWIGSMIEDAGVSTARAKLYRFSVSEGLEVFRSGIQISNGLCWDQERARMYFADSPTGKILLASMVDGEPREFADFADALPGAHPDGATVDKDGFVWSAQWGAGAVVRYAPDGSVDMIIRVPCPQPTCVAFGGPGLSSLYVTSARVGLTEAELARYPNSGAVFVYDTDYRGVPEPIFQLHGAAGA
jgi:sugar lactone lactonase YvrE